MLVHFTQFLNDSDTKAIRETFQHMDADFSGSIEIEELREAYEFINQLSQEGKLEKYCERHEDKFEGWEVLDSD